MRAARMHAYKQPLALEDVQVPRIRADEVMVKVGAAGMCRTDVQLIDGYFRDWSTMELPATLGHEITGWISEIGSEVPPGAELAVGDQVVVEGAWGDGLCRMCNEGHQQICAHGRWAGFGPNGGYQEFIPVPYAHLIRVDKKCGLPPEVLAPLTDAGVTPYRGIKKLLHAGALGPGKTLAVIGVGGLGTYAVQYAKLLSGGSTVVVFGRSDDKLAIAKTNGADHTINIRGQSVGAIREQLRSLTGRGEIDAAIDCIGAEETISLGFGLLAIEGAFASVGLVGTRATFPLFPFVSREYRYFGSFWGSHNDLAEVVALAEQGKLTHTVKKVAFEDINENLELLRQGEIVGRAVVVF